MISNIIHEMWIKKQYKIWNYVLMIEEDFIDRITGHTCENY